MMSDMPQCFDARPLYMCVLSRKLGQQYVYRNSPFEVNSKFSTVSFR